MITILIVYYMILENLIKKITEKIIKKKKNK